MNTIMQKARVYGQQAIAPAKLLPGLAVDAAKAVVAGEAEPADASAIYLAYYDAKIKRSAAQAPVSQRVQVSKLRQIMKLAETFDHDAVKLLARVTELHSEHNGKRKQLYVCMVDAARHALLSKRLPGDRALSTIIAP